MGTTILNMRPRKLSAISGSLYVSLPIEWCHHHDLRAKDAVSVSVDEESRLVISPGGKDAEARA
ncbi:AbrB/MazE/SpoVT family DNA-binding domain-containing protein [Candidatus Woesearchaeota archaeon]|nr:AbrB/MazE/SpoVT family DNA-binding domain-containing protein [Candidatus Woesearchaeota archaeon]